MIKMHMLALPFNIYVAITHSAWNYSMSNIKLNLLVGIIGWL